MGIQHLSEDTLLIILPENPQSTDDLEIAADMTGTEPNINVIVDMSLVEIMPSAMLSDLMILEKQLGNSGRQLILCSVPPTILKLFTTVGLNGLFTFSDDQLGAVQLLRSGRCYYP